MTLDEIRQEAIRVANTYDINWDKLADPIEAKYLETALNRGIPLLEDAHQKLSNGKSVVFPNLDSPLPYEEREEALQLVEENLFDAYILQEIHTRYTLINNILTNA